MLPECEVIEGSGLACTNTTDPAVVREEGLKLLDAGAELLVPACGRVAGAAFELIAQGMPIVDILTSAAHKAIDETPVRSPKPFKVGLIGGLGPAATVDLYDKIVKATPAKNDQEHFKLVVEQNPQIADRTARLLKGGAIPRSPCTAAPAVSKRTAATRSSCPATRHTPSSPTLNATSTFRSSTCRSQRWRKQGQARGQGPASAWLATSGTVQTGIYGDKAKALNLPMFVPDEVHQERVMAAIYGPLGAKAGYTDGQCREDLVSAAEYLVKTYDCNCLILGCTELPLILDECDGFDCAGKKVCVVDPDVRTRPQGGSHRRRNQQGPRHPLIPRQQTAGLAGRGGCPTIRQPPFFPLRLMQDLSVYILVTFVTCVTPGSGVLYTVTSGLRGGLRTALASPLGTTLGVALMSFVSATGLGALIASSPTLYAGLQLISAAVLFWLGWRSWNAGAVRLDKLGRLETDDSLTFAGIFKGALCVQASNVMLIVFLLSLMPQFISPEDDYVSRVTLLSILFVFICFLVHLGYSIVAAVARRWLAGPRFSFWLNRVSGSLFWLLALSVIWNALFNR